MIITPLRFQLRTAAITVLAAVLVSCGGGGGGGGGDNGGGSGGGGGPTGFVPTAPTPAGQLYANGQLLRPMAAGARWIYHSHDYTIANVLQTTVVQSAGAAGGIDEVDSISPGEVNHLSIDARGNVVSSTTLALGPGIAPITISGIEMPAAVRVNDQFVQFDQRIANVGDIDGDGRSDSLDLAVWRIVVGNETFTPLDALPAMTALRIDSFAAARANLANGTVGPVVTTRASTWYAPGIGPVRNTLDSTSTARPFDTTADLLGYDGLTTGWGYVVQNTTVAPLGTRAIPMADGAMLDTGLSHIKLDRNGSVVSTQPFAPVGVTPPASGFVRIAAGFRKITGTFPDLSIYSLADDGAVLPSPPVPIDLRGRVGQQPFDSSIRIDGAANAPVMWMAWERRYQPAFAVTASEMVLRSVDPAGNLSPEMLFPVSQVSDPNAPLSIVARANDVVLTWREIDNSVPGPSVNRQRIVVVNNAGTTIANTGFDMIALAIATPALATRPVADDSRMWLLWNGATAGSSTAVPHGLRIGSSGLPVGVGTDTASLFAAVVDGLNSDLTGDTFPRQVTAAGTDGWFVTGRGFGLIYPDVTVQSTWLTYAEYATGVGALTGHVQELRRLRIPIQADDSQVIAFNDRVLVLAGTGAGLRPIVVWGR